MADKKPSRVPNDAAHDAIINGAVASSVGMAMHASPRLPGKLRLAGLIVAGIGSTSVVAGVAARLSGAAPLLPRPEATPHPETMKAAADAVRLADKPNYEEHAATAERQVAMSPALSMRLSRAADRLAGDRGYMHPAMLLADTTHALALDRVRDAPATPQMKAAASAALDLARAAAVRTEGEMRTPMMTPPTTGSSGSRSKAAAPSSDGMTDAYYRTTKTGRVMVKGYATPKK